MKTLSSWFRKDDETERVRKKPRTEEAAQVWQFRRHSLSVGKCWIDICDRLPPDMQVSATLFDELWNLHPAEKGVVKLYGKVLSTPRWQQSFGQSYTFSGLTHEALPLTHPFLKHLSDRVYEHAGYPYLQVLINWYQDGTHRIGWHSDDETQLADPEWDSRIGIYSFSFGATRRFDLRAKNSKQSEMELNVKNNTCLIMLGQTQRYYKHQVPAQVTCHQRRINVTFRLFRDTFLTFNESVLQLLTLACGDASARIIHSYL